MTDSSELFSLLRLYANKQNNPVIFFTDFCDYMQKYSRHYLETKPDLVVFIDNPQNAISELIDELEQTSQVISSIDSRNRRILTIPQFFIDKITQRYREVINNSEVPFPLESEVDSQFTNIIEETVNFGSDYFEYFEGTNESTPGMIKRLIFSEEVPPLIIPPTITSKKMIELCLTKIRFFFLKNDFKDFILKNF